jgi:DeoR/GlpR family transcriptional regulator of sugar metabolism
MMIHPDAGTTVAALARRIALLTWDLTGLAVVTNSHLALSALGGARGIGLAMLGGAYRHVSRCTPGSPAERMVREKRFDAAFPGVDSLCPEMGIGEEDLGRSP